MQKPRLIAGFVTVIVLAFAGIAWAVLPPGGTFTDDDGHTFEGAIEAIAAEGITLGCNPPANTMFCPEDQVTRGQMAIFITRSYHLPATRWTSSPMMRARSTRTQPTVWLGQA